MADTSHKKSDNATDAASKSTPTPTLLSKRIIGKISEFDDIQRYHLFKYSEIGMSLSGEDDIDKLLELIVLEARDLSGADAGTLYLVNEKGTHLDFVIMQNDTLGTRQGGTSGIPVTLPPVPLIVDGKPNHAHVSSHVALTGQIVNIDDVYTCEDFDFSGSRSYDETTGYCSKSMMVIPLRNHENDIIGVLQLLNALDRQRGEPVKFPDDYVGLITSLASQAAAALTKTKLIQDLKGLFEAFIKSIATAIEEKSRYTGGHIARVANLTVLIAEMINAKDSGPYKDTRFSKDEMEELRIAAWLHDIGKIVTPEHVVDKSTKLETIFDRVQLIKTRFDLIAALERAEYHREKAVLLQSGDTAKSKELDAGFQQALDLLEEEKQFIVSCNSPGEYMSDERLERLKSIAAKTYELNGATLPYLTRDELTNLCITKGTLTAAERKVIENHAIMTNKILSELPFPGKLGRVPEYAGAHHEKLDGSGYPRGLKGGSFPLQARIMAVADVFEALTARDRPYKRPMPLSQAIRILGHMKDDNHIDANVHDLFVESPLLSIYAAEELNPDQIDIELASVEKKARVMVLHERGEYFPTLIKALEEQSVSIKHTSDASECFNLCREANVKRIPFRLVLVDSRLSGGPDPVEVARTLLDVKGFGVSEVVMMNVNPEDSDFPRIQELGPYAALPVHYTVEELYEAVFGALGEKRPEKDVDIAARHLVAQKPSGPQSKNSILIVDDSVNSRMLLQYYLQGSPYTVETAENGLAALKTYVTGHHSLVFMDLGMPIMDGNAATRSMRTWEKTHNVDPRPIIAMSSHGYIEEESLHRDTGYNAFVTKPITKKDFLSLINSFLA